MSELANRAAKSRLPNAPALPDRISSWIPEIPVDFQVKLPAANFGRGQSSQRDAAVPVLEFMFRSNSWISAKTGISGILGSSEQKVSPNIVLSKNLFSILVLVKGKFIPGANLLLFTMSVKSKSRFFSLVGKWKKIRSAGVLKRMRGNTGQTDQKICHRHFL